MEKFAFNEKVNERIICTEDDKELYWDLLMEQHEQM